MLYGEKEQELIGRMRKIREKAVKDEIDSLTKELRKLTPWSYVKCDDGLLRIGIYVEKKRLFEETINYFALDGFVVEETKMYIHDEAGKISTSWLLQEIFENLVNYAYVGFPSNWPNRVNQILEQSGIEVVNDKSYMSSDEAIKTFKNVEYEIARMCSFYLLYFNDTAQYHLGWTYYTYDIKSVAFFCAQGISLNNEENSLHIKTPINPDEDSRVYDYIINTWHIKILDNLMTKLEEDAKSSIVIKGEIPDKLVSKIEANKLVVTKQDNSIKISLV